MYLRSHPIAYYLMPVLIVSLFFMNHVSAQGTWAPLSNAAPHQSLGGMLLLSDGSVLCKTSSGGGDGEGSLWDKLTPDTLGSYINGTWSTINPMYNTRLYFASQVLKDGRVFVAGGEYGTGGQFGETYDPVADLWTLAPYNGQYFGDANSEILPDGRVLIGVLSYNSVVFVSDTTDIFDPASNTWTAGPLTAGGHDESTWVKLKDSSILMVDFDSITTERYIPALNRWIADAPTPVWLYDSIEFETGPAFLLPDGRVFFTGATGHTATYTPSGNTGPGSWVAGPDIPGGYSCADASGAMMVNGKILISAAPIPSDFAPMYPSPTVFFEYDYLANSFTQIGVPGGGDSIEEPSYVTTMLDLPDGNVLLGQFDSSTYYVYTPGSAPLAAGKPVINQVVQNHCDSFAVTGTLFNGISEGACYGDDWQMATNYPLVRLTRGNRVYYARTFNWNRTGVQTGAQPDTVKFQLPAGLPVDTYSLSVVANGISSDPVSFVAPALPYLTSTLVAPAICSGAPFTYTAAATAGASFTWTRAAIPGISNAAITTPQTANPSESLVDTTGIPLNVIYNYVVTYNGCSVTEQVQVTVNSVPDPGYIYAVGPTTLCLGSTLSLYDYNYGNSSIVWNPTGDTTGYLNIFTGGDYYVTNTNICGTDTTNHIFVTALPYQSPVVNLTGLPLSDTLCFNSGPIAITGTPLGGSLLYDGYDTLINGSLFNPDTASLYPDFEYDYTDTNGCPGSAYAYLAVDSCTTLGIAGVTGPIGAFTVYPNPANDVLNINAQGLPGGAYTLTLLNTTGQIIHTQQINIAGSFTTTMGLDDLAPGIYLLSLVSGEVRQTLKVVKY